VVAQVQILGSELDQEDQGVSEQLFRPDVEYIARTVNAVDPIKLLSEVRVFQKYVKVRYCCCIFCTRKITEMWPPYGFCVNNHAVCLNCASERGTIDV
jgi:hypothetical protein